MSLGDWTPLDALRVKHAKVCDRTIKEELLLLNQLHIKLEAVADLSDRGMMVDRDEGPRLLRECEEAISQALAVVVSSEYFVKEPKLSFDTFEPQA